MAQTIKLKRSSVSGNIPLTTQLDLGEVAINTFDGKMYIKKDDGTEHIVEVGYNLGVVQEYIFTATASQTVFTGLDDNSIGFVYNPGNIQVFLNGVLLEKTVDFTETSSTTLTLSEPVDAADMLQIFSFNKKIGDGRIAVNTFTGNGSNTSFTLSVAPENVNNISVYIDGIYQSKSNYTISGTTLNFGATPPPLDTAIEVEIATREVSIDTTTGLSFADNVKAKFGNDDDLEIFHDGSNSIINDTGTGNLKFQVGGTDVAEVTVDGLVVTGDVEADEFIGDLRGAVEFHAKAGEVLAKGDVVYISGISGNTTVVSKADADDPAKMPAFGVVSIGGNQNANVEVVTFGTLSGLNTSTFTEGDEIFVSNTAGAYTNSAPTGETSALQKIGKITRADSNGSIKVIGAGRSNATPNLNDGNIFIGNASNQATTASLNTKIEDYLDAGSSTPNFTTANITTGTIGTLTVSTEATIPYDNSISGLTATNVQSAISELNNLLGGGNVGSQASFDSYEFTATTNQTTFDLANLGISPTPGYIAGYIQVFLNGVLLAEADYTATDGQTIVLGAAADLNDIITVTILDSFDIANVLRVTSFDASAPQDNLVVTSTGNVGISTTSPENGVSYNAAARVLGIAGSGAATSAGYGAISLTNNRATPSGSDDLGKISFGSANDTGPEKAYIYASAVGSGGATGGYGSNLIFATRADNGGLNNNMLIDSSGNVGIGETLPSTPLHVNSGTGNIAATFESTDAGSFINLRDNGSGTFGGMIGAFSDDIVFYPNNVEAMRITTNGNILQQGGSPEYHFGTSSASHYNWRIAAQEVVDAGFEIASGTQSVGSGALSDTYTTRFTIKGDTGNVGIGTLNPDAPLDVHVIEDTYTNYRTQLRLGHTKTNGVDEGSSLTFTAAGDALGAVIYSNGRYDNDVLVQEDSVRPSGFISFGNGLPNTGTGIIEFGGLQAGTTTPIVNARFESDGALNLLGAGLEVDGQTLIDTNGAIKSVGAETQLAKTYNLPTTGGSSQWIKLGTFITNQSGRSIHFKFVARSGYNANSAQTQTSELKFGTSNNLSAGTGLDSSQVQQTSVFFGDAQYYKYEDGNSVAAPNDIVILQKSNSSYEFWGLFGTFTGQGSFFVVSHNTSDAFTYSGSQQTAFPTIGASEYYVQKSVIGIQNNTIVVADSSGRVALSGSIGASSYLEKASIVGTAVTFYNVDTLANSVLYITANATGNWTTNVRGGASITLDSILGVGESVTVAVLATQGTTAYLNTGLQVDGTPQTVKWQGGSAPSAGNASSVDVYSFTILKTASATYTVFGSQTQFA